MDFPHGLIKRCRMERGCLVCRLDIQSLESTTPLLLYPTHTRLKQQEQPPSCLAGQLQARLDQASARILGSEMVIITIPLGKDVNIAMILGYDLSMLVLQATAWSNLLSCFNNLSRTAPLMW